jgi:hypothetical protein
MAELSDRLMSRVDASWYKVQQRAADAGADAANRQAFVPLHRHHLLYGERRRHCHGAAHGRARNIKTMQVYDWRSDNINVNEIERAGI